MAIDDTRQDNTGMQDARDELEQRDQSDHMAETTDADADDSVL